MMEKIYNTMKSVGVWNLVLGILTIVAGAVAGTFGPMSILWTQKVELFLSA